MHEAEVQTADRQHDAERDPQQVHRVGPDQLEPPGDQPIERTAEVPGEDPQQGGQDDRDHRGFRSDLKRVATAVEQSDRDVAARVVRPQEELGVPGRPDRQAELVQRGVDVLVRWGRCARRGSRIPAPAGKGSRSPGTGSRRPARPCCASAGARPAGTDLAQAAAPRHRRSRLTTSQLGPQCR